MNITVWPQPILIKSVWLVTNTTAASRRLRISINWNPTFQTFFMKQIFKNQNENFSDHSDFFLLYIKNWTKVVPLKKIFCSWKKILLVWNFFLLKFYEVRSERWDFNLCWSGPPRYVLWCWFSWEWRKMFFFLKKKINQNGRLKKTEILKLPIFKKNRENFTDWSLG